MTVLLIVLVHISRLRLALHSSFPTCFAVRVRRVELDVENQCDRNALDSIVAEGRRLGIDVVFVGYVRYVKLVCFLCHGGRAQKRWKRMLRDS